MNDIEQKQKQPEYLIQIYAKSKALSVEPYTGDKDCERYITVEEAIEICETAVNKSNSGASGSYFVRSETVDEHIKLFIAATFYEGRTLQLPTDRIEQLLRKFAKEIQIYELQKISDMIDGKENRAHILIIERIRKLSDESK